MNYLIVIPGLLAGRRPPVVYEEANIEGVRMIVIVGNEVDTVVQFSRGGSADMPQISSYQTRLRRPRTVEGQLQRNRPSLIDHELPSPSLLT